jgi:hypothetical protein
MGETRPPQPATLIVGMLSAFPELFDVAEEILSKEYGPVAMRSEIFDFNFTHYYEPEMGHGIKRKFLAFERPIQPDEIAAIKNRTNRIEREIAAASPKAAQRPINLDPGCIDAGKLILATVKDQAHRVYLRDGIYAEVTLYWKHGKWETWPWTYADYRSDGYQHFLARVREYHMSRRA